MSDDQSSNEAETVEPQEGEQSQQSEAFDAEYVAKLRRENAKYRNEAKAGREAAQRLAEIEETKKTDEEKIAERIQAAERRAAELEAKANRGEVAGTTGVPLEVLAGPEDSSVEALRDFAEKVIEYAGRSNAPRVPKIDPNQGRNSSVALNGDGLEQALRNKLGIS